LEEQLSALEDWLNREREALESREGMVKLIIWIYLFCIPLL
jgi:hypothetical protein